MELWQIMAIVLSALFFIILLIFIVTYSRGKARREERDEQLSKMYADPNLAKMEYDFAMYDEETERLVDRAMGKGGQASANPDGDQQLSFLGAADTEGIEEITGNYKP